MPDPASQRSLSLWLATAAAAAVVCLLAASLPPDGFFSGDPGVKLIAAFNAIDHPVRAFDIDLPRIEGTPTRYVERFFWIHGDHAHVLQSPVFPVMTAPLVAAFGLRGAYVLPAVAFVLLLPLVAPVYRSVAPGAPLWIFVLVVVAANPVFFYAFEFWEHVPAVALLAWATALVLRDDASTRSACAAGVLVSAAILLRPEAAWYTAGLAVVTPWRRAAVFGAGVAAVLLPVAMLNYAVFGNPLGPHMAANLAPMAGRWLETRLHRVDVWLVPSSSLALTGLAVIVLAHLGRLARIAPEHRQVIALAGASLLVVAAASGQLGRDSLWQAWPAGALVLARGWHRDDSAARLWLILGVAFLLVVLTSTHDGGAQWGPRFLLIATPALVALSAWAAAAFWAESGSWRRARMALVIVVLASSVFVSRNAFRELRGAKRYYAGLTAATARLVPEHGYVVTNVWWFDQITAALHNRHTVLNVVGSAQAAAALHDLQAHAIRQAVLVTSRDEPADVSANEVGRGNCFSAVASERVPERDLTFTQVRCR